MPQGDRTGRGRTRPPGPGPSGRRACLRRSSGGRGTAGTRPTAVSAASCDGEHEGSRSAPAARKGRRRPSRPKQVLQGAPSRPRPRVPRSSAGRVGVCASCCLPVSSSPGRERPPASSNVGDSSLSRCPPGRASLPSGRPGYRSPTGGRPTQRRRDGARRGGAPAPPSGATSPGRTAARCGVGPRSRARPICLHTAPRSAPRAGCAGGQ